MSQNSQEQDVRRTEYTAVRGRDQWIVPLLREGIERTIGSCRDQWGDSPSVLDVGCGQQPTRRLLEEAGFRYYSIDMQQNGQGNVDFLGVIDAPLPQALLEAAPFPFLLCTEVMEHVPNWDIAFENFARLTTPGGRLFITCPFVFPLHEEPYDFWRPTGYALAHHAKRYGFRVVEQENAGGGWEVLGTFLLSVEAHAKPGLVNMVQRRVINFFRKAVAEWIFRSKIGDRIWLHGRFYLSNFALLEKIGEASTDSQE